MPKAYAKDDFGQDVSPPLMMDVLDVLCWGWDDERHFEPRPSSVVRLVRVWWRRKE